jgi:hypothetical protein
MTRLLALRFVSSHRKAGNPACTTTDSPMDVFLILSQEQQRRQVSGGHDTKGERSTTLLAYGSGGEKDRQSRTAASSSIDLLGSANVIEGETAHACIYSFRLFFTLGVQLLVCT